MKSAKRKAIAQNLKFKYIALSIEFYLSYHLKFKYIALSIEFYLSYLVYYIAKMKK